MSKELVDNYYDLLRPNRIPSFVNVATETKKIFRVSKIDCWHQTYIALNTKNWINSLIIDIDGGDVLSTWDKVMPDLIKPNYMSGRWMTCLEWKGIRFNRPHVVIHLSTPINKKNVKQMVFYTAVRDEILFRLASAGLNVDVAEPITTKNPASSHWAVKTFGENFMEKEWNLTELSRLLGLKKGDKRNKIAHKKHFLKKITEFNTDSRNCTIFEKNRHYAYKLRSQCISQKDLFQKVLTQCFQSNNEMYLCNSLSNSEVVAIAKSISTWTWANYTGSGVIDTKNRGAAAKYINKEDDTQKRQKIGAYYTAMVKVSKNQDIIKKALTEAYARGERPSQLTLSRQLRLSLNTIKKYWDFALQSDAVKLVSNAHRKLMSTVSSSVEYIDTQPIPAYCQLGDIREKGILQKLPCGDTIYNSLVDNSDSTDNNDFNNDGIYDLIDKMTDDIPSSDNHPKENTNTIYLKDYEYLAMIDDEEIKRPAFLLR